MSVAFRAPLQMHYINGDLRVPKPKEYIMLWLKGIPTIQKKLEVSECWVLRGDFILTKINQPSSRQDELHNKEFSSWGIRV